MIKIASDFKKIIVQRRKQTKNHINKIITIWANCRSAGGKTKMYLVPWWVGRAGLPLPGGDPWARQRLLISVP